MSPQQAVQILDQLCNGFGKRLSNDEAEEYVKHLRTMPYDMAEKAAWECVHRLEFFPRFGKFRAVAEDMTGQGTANAQSTRPSTGAKVSDYELWRSLQIVTMPEDAYWAVVLDHEAAQEAESQWHQTFAQMGGVRS